MKHVFLFDYYLGLLVVFLLHFWSSNRDTLFYWYVLSMLLVVCFAGRISITLDSSWEEPFSNKTEDVDAAERSMEFRLGWFANPIYFNGDYPKVMKDNVARKSQLEGRQKSRLPVFTDAEKARIVGKLHTAHGLQAYV